MTLPPPTWWVRSHTWRQHQFTYEKCKLPNPHEYLEIDGKISMTKITLLNGQHRVWKLLTKNCICWSYINTVYFSNCCQCHMGAVAYMMKAVKVTDEFSCTCL